MNMTWKYQLPAFSFYFSILLFLLLIGKIDLKQQFTIFNLVWISFCLCYLIYKYVRASIFKEENLYAEKNWKI
jgi:hypothetical protein